MAELQANHSADLYTALGLLSFKAVSLWAAHMLCCYTDFMDTKSATTISFVDPKTQRPSIGPEESAAASVGPQRPQNTSNGGLGLFEFSTAKLCHQY